MILDAPDLRDDYYLNLIDWGNNDVLTVALNDTVYLLLKNNESNVLMKIDSNLEYISSLNWMN